MKSKERKIRFKVLNKEVIFAGKQLRLIFLTSLLLLSTCIFFSSCTDNDDDTIAPKPRAYFRLSFPEKKYIRYDSVCPFNFDMPVYSKIDNDKNYRAEPCWLNLNFPTFNGTLHLSYKAVNGNIQQYLEDTYTLASKHQIKASGIEEQLISKDSSKVYGLIYDIQGNAASSIQFFLTDSTHHFIRGAMYFNAIPNTDSIAPVVEFIKKDIYQMIASFEWKNNSNLSGGLPKAVHKK
ncbi:MAG: gliding motility lipoprotein GldD [Bacteroidota bacterium]